MSIKIAANLHPKQLQVLNGLKRFTIFRAGRRLGKTYLAVYYLLKFAVTHPKSLSWMVCLDINTCTELSMPQFEALCPPGLIKHKNRQTRTFTLYNDARIVWKTGETADALRGRGLDLVILEECAFWKNGHALWFDVLRPQLTGNGGRALFITSPNGSNWMRRLEEQAKQLIAAGSKEWAIFTGSINDNPRITKEEIDALRSTTPATTWNQEYLGLFEDRIGLVYWNLQRLRDVVSVAPTAKRILNIRGADWGLNDETAFVWIAMLENKKAYVFDEHVANNLDVPTHARLVKAKTMDIIRHTCMDSAAWNRDASMTSVAKRFADAGIPLVKATKDFDGSVSDLKALLDNGDILIDHKCKRILDAVESWNHGTHEPDCLAAFRYGIDSLVRMGLLMPPIKSNRPLNPKEIMDARIKAAKESEAFDRKVTNPYMGLSMRIYNK